MAHLSCIFSSNLPEQTPDSAQEMGTLPSSGVGNPTPVLQLQCLWHGMWALPGLGKQ